MDICGPNWTQNFSIYSGRLESPSQYIASLFSSRNGCGQSKRTTTETPKELEKYQHMSEDEEKQFVLQKNGKYTLVLSKYKNMVLSVFKGNMYCHIWNNKNKMHVSLNLDELAYVLKNKTVIQDIMEQLLMPYAEKKFPNFPFEMQKKWYICTGSFWRQEDGVVSVQGECVLSHLEQQESETCFTEQQ